MGPVDARVGRVDDHEHFRRKLGAPAVKHHAWHFDLADLARMALVEEVQPSDPMLAVDDQVLPLGFAEKPDGVGVAHLLEAQRLVGEEEHRAGYHRLCHDRPIKIHDLFNLLAIQNALKAFLASFNAGDELGDIIMLRYPTLLDFLALEIIPAGESNLFEQVGRFVGNEVEGTIFLAHARRKHDVSFLAGERRWKCLLPLS